jgi:hypothetical protein
MGPVSGDAGDLAYFAERGLNLRVDERDLDAEHMSKGEPGRASFYREGRSYFCVSIMRSDGTVLAPDYGIGDL